jgi:hypothetical protein
MPLHYSQLTVSNVQNAYHGPLPAGKIFILKKKVYQGNERRKAVEEGKRNMEA